MTQTLGSLLDERVPFVGREAERAALLRLLEDEGPVLTFVAGIAGIGKSALLSAFAAEARAGGALVATVDGDVVEPTEAGFLRGLGAALGTPLADVAGAAAALAAHGRAIVAIDAFERLRLLDDWLRRVLVPALPASARVAIAGRDAPVAAWSAQYGPLMQVLELDSLPAPEAVALLQALGAAPARAVAINRVLRGHPLSLRLAASTPSALEGTGEGAVRPATDELARVYLSELDPDVREALDAASVVRRVTVPLLAAMTPEVPGADSFARLRALPFATVGAEGLVVNHVLREVVAGELRAIDPPRHRRLRAAAWRHLRGELDAAADADLWRSTADMLYLLERPAVRDAFFPTSAHRCSVEPARADDGAAIAAIAARHDTAEGVAQLRAWWEALPEAFFAGRGADGAVTAFSAVCASTAVPAPLLAADPIAATWREHLRRAPLARGEQALCIRFMCGAESGERPGPDVAPLFLDLKRTYLAMRPALRRVYACTYETEAMGATLEPLGFERIGAGTVLLGGREHVVYCNDFGSGSVDGWLARLASRDVLAGGEPLLDPERRRLVLDGASIELSPLEFGVLRCLHERADRVVRRETLLREVWRSEWSGDGNALESVVSALRRKLGAHASALETVRGAGYRLRPLV